VWAQTGSRPTAPRDLGFESAYLFGAVCPALGKAAAIVMPRANTEAMNLHLEEISCHVPADSHAIMFVDNAAWHFSKALRVPRNLTLLPLPPYSPELNPAAGLFNALFFDVSPKCHGAGKITVTVRFGIRIAALV